ncbi:hypothetical protein GALMADRAFT_66422 [Galerina marginata CBS 339.88]|uniref:Peptidase C14 caspase domain-containing protein n=1 Tax=Galerina marginata (strain CBS 339.88) TaxID=685588 RepID=A0A067TEE9_GALM3|nr:hypothetical protein GALMADRAFT_66422 [Galerina marginata CBS 339.88]
MSPDDSERPPPILAVVIGINEYSGPDYDNLSGAAGDADAFEAFLTGRMDVPKDNIRSLRDQQATREEIIKSFLWLQDNNKYKKNEAAMIFYFAGHGAQTEKPDEWDDWVTTTGNIEMLCPSDIGMPTSTVTECNGNGDRDHKTVPGIPDRTISLLLNHISDCKGNNITVILDCCSSGGMVRSQDQDGYVIRRLISPPRIDSNFDEKILSWGTRNGRSVEGLSRKSHASHILLAACGRDQFALEDPKSKRGLFTSHLLKALDSDDFHTLSYVSLMHRLRMPERQTPHCEGEGIYWRLFNNRVSGADPSFILTKRVKDGPITLEAGSAQGITVGSRFAVHRTNLMDTPILRNPCLGHLVVTSVDTFSSRLSVAPTSGKIRLPWLFYCKLFQRANVKSISLYSADRPWLESIFPQDSRTELSVTIVNNVQACDLEINVIDGKVCFDRHNHLVTHIIGSRLRHTVDVDDVDTIRAVVKGSLHFYYHLTRPAPYTFQAVRMELKELKEELNEEFDVVFKPFGKNLIAEKPATIVVDENAQLGMTICNNSKQTLYPYLFYFDPTDLTIIDWYLPPFGGGAGSLTTKVDAALPPNSKLAIGYGDGGAVPWQFLLPKGEQKDLGFFRLFLSTRPAYFENILQERTPFASGSVRSVRLGPAESPEAETWGVQTVTVIQVAR